MKPSPAARLLDLSSLLLVLVGAAGYAWTFIQMQALRDKPHDPTAPLDAGFNRFVQLMQWNHASLGVIAAGIVAGVAAAWYHRRQRQRRPGQQVP